MEELEEELIHLIKNILFMSIRKMLSDEDLCHPLDSLLSNKNNFINGQNILIDGGWTLW